MSSTRDSMIVEGLSNDQLDQLISECSAIDTLVLARDYGFKVSSFTMRGDKAEKIEQWSSLASVGGAQCKKSNRFKVIWVEF